MRRCGSSVEILHGAMLVSSVAILVGCGKSIHEERMERYNLGLVGRNYAEVASALNSETRTSCIVGKYRLGLNGGRCLQQPEFISTGSYTMRWYGPVHRTFYSAGPNSYYGVTVYYEDVDFNNGVCVNVNVGESAKDLNNLTRLGLFISNRNKWYLLSDSDSVSLNALNK